MKSVAIFAGLVGLASATGWGNSSAPVHKPSSSSTTTTWLHPTAPVSSSTSSWVHPTTSKATSKWVEPSSSSSVVKHNSTVTEELTTYTTTTICPVTETHGATTLTKLTTSTITVTKPVHAAHPTESWVKPNSTKTEDITVYTTTTICPVTETHGATTITKLTTSLITVTSCKGGCKPTTAAHWVPSGKPSQSSESKVWGNATTVVTKKPQTVTLYSTNKVTVTSCGPHGCPVTTLTSSVPTGVKIVTEHPSTVTEKTTVLTTTCPVTTTYVSQGTTKTSVYTTVSTYSTVVKPTAPAPSAPAPSAPAPSAPAPSAPAPSAPAPSAPAPSAPAPSAPAPSAPAPSAPAATTPAASVTTSSVRASSTTAAQPSVSVFLGAGSINNAPVAIVGGLMALAAFF